MLNCLIPWINAYITKETRYKRKYSGYYQKLILRKWNLIFHPRIPYNNMRTPMLLRANLERILAL